MKNNKNNKNNKNSNVKDVNAGMEIDSCSSESKQPKMENKAKQNKNDMK